MDLRECLNKIDHYCIDNNQKFYDLRSLYESVEPKLTPQEKMELSKIVRDTNDPKVISASLNQMVSESLNEYLTQDELISAIENGKPFDLNDFKRYAHTDGPAYKELDHKMVLDSDGFQTDYTLYYDYDLGEYICIFGDRDLYNPDNADFDAEFETEEEAREWFDSYNGFEDDWMDESVNESLPFESLDKSLLQESNESFEYKGFTIVDGDPVYVYKNGRCIGSYSTDTDAIQQIDVITESYSDTLGGVGTAAGTALGLLEPTPFGEVAGAAVGGQVGKAVGGILDAIHQHKLNKAVRNNNRMTEELTGNEDPYSLKEIISILRKLTNNFSKEGSVKTFYKEEKELAKNVLKKYYKYVDVSNGRHDSNEEMNWVISFSGVK